eukprot:20971_1
MDLYSLTGLYRIANKCNDNELKMQLKCIINIDIADDNKLNIEDNIIACFKLNGKQWIIQNGIDYECKWNSVYKINKLIIDYKYVFDDSVCNEIPNKIARETHLKYHAEKKALSILLFEAKKMEEMCSISVSIPMCNDCHKFFAEMSKYCNCEIHCDDPNGLHTFMDGTCSLCL